MKITIEYESSWRNSFLDGNNNEPLPKKGRDFVGSMTSLKKEGNFLVREITLDTVMGILNRLIGDQRKLYLMAFARVIRGEVLTTKEADYIAAARVIGVSNWKIIQTHIIPNSISPVLVLASLSIGETILVIAGLSFLGLGIQPPMASLGGMLSNGQQYLHQNLLMSVVPGVTILLIVFSFNLFGDGVRDALDSRLTD